MTTQLTTRSGRPVTARAAGHHTTIRDVPYTGTAADLTARITHYRNRGILVAMTAPEPVRPGEYATVLRLRVVRDPATERVAAAINQRAKASRRTRIAVIVAAIAGTVAGLLTAGAYLIGQLVELIAAHAAIILGVLALAVILAALCTRRSRHRHCPGC